MSKEVEYPAGLEKAIAEYRQIQAPEHIRSQVMHKIEQRKSNAWLPRLSFAGAALAFCTIALVFVTANVQRSSKPHIGLSHPIPSLASLRTPSITSINTSKLRKIGGLPTFSSTRISFPSSLKTPLKKHSEALLFNINNSSQAAV